MLGLWPSDVVEHIRSGVAKRYTAAEHLQWMLRSCNMTGQHALSGRGYNREGYADSVYAPAVGDCAFDRRVPCRIPCRDSSSELPAILYCKPETVVDIRDILKEDRRR
eukprot:6209589-Pleurochrysis_carterae.AAC.1